jgi:malate synthase
MTVPFMRAYTELLVRTCHRRGAHAIGGMAAFIPSRKDAAVNATAMMRVGEDKTREAADGFDGSWVAHPDLVGAVLEVFNAKLGTRPNQKDRLREDVHVTRDQLLDVRIAGGQVSESGIRTNIRVALEYIENWLDGRGAVGIANLMEDSATAEISRTQLRQWVSQGVTLADGRRCTAELYRALREEETSKLAAAPDASARLASSAALMDHLVLGAAPEDFLTLPAYEQLG